jgi:hypothetical protein
LIRLALGLVQLGPRRLGLSFSLLELHVAGLLGERLGLLLRLSDQTDLLGGLGLPFREVTELLDVLDVRRALGDLERLLSVEQRELGRRLHARIRRGLGVCGLGALELGLGGRLLLCGYAPGGKRHRHDPRDGPGDSG